MKYTFDSRQIEPGDVFVALKGEKVDGHNFIDKARAAGAVDIVDGLSDLQSRAKAKRLTLAAKVIGVTGSAGKTTTKELLKTFLACAGKTYGTEANFNNHIGLPLTILNSPADAEFLVLEMGSNHPGEIAALCEIATPDIGVVTGIGTAHLEFFKTREGIAKEKGALIEVAREYAVFPADDDFASALMMRSPLAEGVARAIPGLLDPSVAYPPHFEGNAALAFAVARRFGVSLAAARAALGSFVLPGARWRRVEKMGATFIDDTYNANPDSMLAALETFAAMPTSGRRIVILGDMLELGPEAQSLHEKVFMAASQLGFAKVIGVGEISSHCRADIAFPQVDALSERIGEIVKAGDLVLLKASHGLELGKLLI